MLIMTCGHVPRMLVELHSVLRIPHRAVPPGNMATLTLIHASVHCARAWSAQDAEQQLGAPNAMFSDACR